MRLGTLLLVAMLTASLFAAKKKSVEHIWQTGMLVRIVPGSDFGKETIIPELHASWSIRPAGAAGLLIQGKNEKGENGFWATVLLAREKEPSVHLNMPVKFSVETVPCRFRDNCGVEESKDEFGRIYSTKIRTRTVFYLLDDNGQEFELAKPEFHQALSSSR